MIYGSPYRTGPMRFSRRWWANVPRDLFWVALVSVLVWVYAERKVTETKTFVTAIRLTAGKSTEWVVLDKTEWGGVVYKVEGSREALDRYQQQVKQSVSYDVSPHVAGNGRPFPRELAVPTRDILNQERTITQMGLKVTSADPEAINVRLDRLRRETVPVELVYSNAELVGPPTPKAEIAVAASKWQEILKIEPAPSLRTVEKDLSGRPTGQEILVTFDIIPEIATVPVTLQQASIEAPVTISQTTKTVSMTVSVRVLSPGDWEDIRKFDLIQKDRAEWRPEVKITGATKDLAALQPKDVDAYIVLTDDDKNPVESWLLPRPVQVRFPPGLQVRLEGSPPTVTFKLQKRPEVSAAP